MAETASTTGRARRVGLVAGGLVAAVAAGVALGARVGGARAAAPRAPLPDIHSEYVRYLSGHDSIDAFIAFPEAAQPAPGVIVIHEIFGMSDFVRAQVVALAKQGFVAIAPDLLSRGGGTPASQDSAVKLISHLPPDQVTADLNGAYAYLKTLKSVRGDRIGVIGFCWGGGQSFRYATNNPKLSAFVVCYGPAPDSAALARIRAPGLGAYAAKDARISSGVPDAAALLRKLGKDYRYTVYPNVGHGFFRTREDPAVADSAWAAVIAFFRRTLERP